VPELIRERLDGEQVAAAVPLADDDALVVTRTRTLRYRSEGLISDASVEEYPHDAEAVSLSEDRRTATIRLNYGVDGDREFTVPTDALDDVLPPLLSAVLFENDVLGTGETVEAVYRLGELTILVAGRRIVKHVGDGVWSLDATRYDYDDVTGLDVEKGEVSSQLIVEVDGRPQWIKIPSDRVREIRGRIEEALLDHHDAASYREFESQQTDDDPENADGAASSDESDGSSERPDDGITDLGIGGNIGGDEPDQSVEIADLAAEVADLREAVERQQDLLKTQQHTIERLIEELKRR